MRTIDRLIEYPLTPLQKHHLREAQIINGIGGEGENIEWILMENIKLITRYDKDKAESLLNDIRELSYDHDLQYFLKLGFYKSNYKFAKKLFHLLHWSPLKRFAIACIAFIILNRF